MATVDLWRYNTNKSYTWTKDEYKNLRSDVLGGKIFARGTYEDGCRDNVANGSVQFWPTAGYDDYLSCYDIGKPFVN